MPHLPKTRCTLLFPVLLATVAPAACGARSDLASEGSGATAGGAGGGAAAGGAGGGTASGGTSTGVGGAAGAGGQALTILEACVVADACADPSPGWHPFTASSCLDGFARLGWWYESLGSLADPTITSLLVKCAAEAEGDCASFHACFGGDWVALSRCREGAECAGDTMVSFPDGPTFECGAIGGQCTMLSSNAPRACCNAEPCSGNGDFTCDAGKASFCGGWGERVDFDCGANGQTCTTDPDAPCKGTDACDPMTTKSACKGTVAVYCVGGGLAVHDCSTTGFRTACNEGVPVWENPCRPAAKDCDPMNHIAGCDGESLLVCVDGALTGVDCTSLGFSGCEQTMAGARCQ